jgi:HK97 family phage major capsid protein
MPRVRPRPAAKQRSSYAEYRAQHKNPNWAALDVDPQYDEYRHVFWKWATAPLSPIDEPRLFLSEAEQRTLSKASAGAGGNLVPSDLEDAILSVAHTRSTIGQLARTLTTPSGVTVGVPSASAHGTAAWVAENSTVTPSDETFAQVSLGAFRATTAVVCSEELVQDATGDFDRFLAEELGARIAQLEGAAYATGDGTGKPQGVTANVGTTVTMATGNTTTYAYASLIDAVHTVAAGYRTPDQNPAWVVSDAGLKALRKIVEGTTNAPLLQDLEQDQPRLLGYPVYVDDNLAAPAANAVSAIFAAWKPFYTIRRVNGIALQRQDELYSAAGQLGYRAYHRVDGRVVIAAAGVAVKHSAT